MTDDALLVVKCLFTDIWSIFTSWHIPGTNVTPMSMALFLIVACFGLRFLYSIIGLSSLDSVSGLHADEQARARTAKADKLRDSRIKENTRRAMNRAADRVRSRELRNSDYYGSM